MIKVEKYLVALLVLRGVEIFNRIRGYISIVKKNNKLVLDEMKNALTGRYYMPSLTRC